MRANSDQRNAERFPVRIPVVYWGDEFLGEGTVVDLSPDGLLVVGNYNAVKGTGLRLMLSLPDDPEPLFVNRAVVRWVRGIELGVELFTMRESDRARLDAFIAGVIQHREAPCATAWPWENDEPRHGQEQN